MNVPAWVWWTTIGVTTAILVFDVAMIVRRPHEPSRKEVSIALSIYIGLAVLFGIGVWTVAGHQYGTEFFAGWLTEYSLSVDNLFIFLLIMASFACPVRTSRAALLIGIILALIFRGIFIALGAAAIEQFSWVFYVFGAFLIYTAVKLARDGHDDEETTTRTGWSGWSAAALPHTDEYHGDKLPDRRTASGCSRRCSSSSSRWARPTCSSRWTRSRRSTASPRSPTWC